MTQNLRSSLSQVDPLIAKIIQDELHRQQNQVELIASENFTSLAVLEATGSVLTNKYAEGYPHRRYYGGCEIVDQAENVAIERACQLFSCQFANVQPHSGSQANQGVFAAFLSPGDTILGMGMEAGGHLTHGAKVNLSGKWFQAHSYGVHPETHLIDYEQVENLAKLHQPKLIIAGGSAYPRTIDFKRFREIADQVGAFLMVDMAHFAGLVAGKAFPSPFPHAHVVTSTTHKTLRGPRGGLILTNDEQIAKKLNSAVFPCLQGGPLMHVIAAKAVAFGEALKSEFQTYCRQVVENAQNLAKTIQNHGLEIVSGGTDCHLLLVNLTPYGITGKQAQETLELAGITCNKNGIPFDPLPPVQASGIRLGTPAATTRGFTIKEFELLGNYIATVLDAIRLEKTDTIVPQIRGEIEKLCQKFPLYPSL